MFNTTKRMLAASAAVLAVAASTMVTTASAVLADQPTPTNKPAGNHVSVSDIQVTKTIDASSP